MASRLDQELAVLAADALPPRVDSALRSRMRSLPPMVQASGLASTCAFLLSQAKTDGPADPYWLTAKALLDAAAGAAGVARHADPRATLDSVVRASGQAYLLAEARAAALAGWLSRLATARASTADTSASASASASASGTGTGTGTDSGTAPGTGDATGQQTSAGRDGAQGGGPR